MSKDLSNEPSGVMQLADNRVLIVEDEVHRAMRLLTIAPNGALVEHNDANEQLTKSFDNKLSDLEAALLIIEVMSMPQLHTQT